MSKLSKQNVTEIKVLIAQGKSQPVIAKQFNVSRSVVSDIATGRVHQDVLWPDGYQPAKVQGGQRRVTDYDPTDARVQDLEAEVVSLRDELTLERKRSKVGAREGGIIRAVVKEMD